MPEYVADTHALIWHLTSDKRLSPAARKIFETADQGAAYIWIPGIVLVEAVYLVERARFPANLLTLMFKLLEQASDNYGVVPLDATLVRVLQTIDAAQVPEMPDRIVAASAKHLGLPLISKDMVMSNVPNLQLIW